MTNNRSTPKSGEIRLGTVDEDRTGTHRYVGVHPYLIVSNDTYNKYSGQSECIPFTTKRFKKLSPSHVNYVAGEVKGITRDSTLVVESRDLIRNECLSEPIGVFTDENWNRALVAMLAQNPCLQKILDSVK